MFILYAFGKIYQSRTNILVIDRKEGVCSIGSTKKNIKTKTKQKK